MELEDRSKEQLGGLGWIEECYPYQAVLSNVVAKVVHEYMQSWHLNVLYENQMSHFLQFQRQEELKKVLLWTVSTSP